MFYYYFTLIMMWVFPLILKSHQMALFSFHILFLNENMLMVVVSDAELHLQPHHWSRSRDWPQQNQTQLCSFTWWSITWQQTLKLSGEFSFLQLHICVTLWTEVSHPDLRFAATLIVIYRIKHAQKSINIFRGKGEKNRWKQELFYIRSVFVLSLRHQEHLTLASSAPRVVTSNGLLRALQGDYLCTISGSLWSLCDNSILS